MSSSSSSSSSLSSSSPSSSSSSSSRSPSSALVYGVLASFFAVGSLACIGVRRAMVRSHRANAKLGYDLSLQIASLQGIYPRLCGEFLADVRDRYDMPSFAVARLARLLDYTILGGKYYRATLVLNTVQQLSRERGTDVELVWDKALVLGWCIEIVSGWRWDGSGDAVERDEEKAEKEK